MKNIILISVLSVLVFGCAKDESNKNKVQNCSDETVSILNKLNNKVFIYNISQSEDSLQGVIAGCKDLKINLGNSSCIAKNTVSDETVTVSYSGVESECEQASAIMNKHQKEKTQLENNKKKQID